MVTGGDGGQKDPTNPSGLTIATSGPNAGCPAATPANNQLAMTYLLTHGISINSNAGGHFPKKDYGEYAPIASYEYAVGNQCTPS
jgi:hypothetical protein